MTTVDDIYRFLDSLAPFSRQASFDNAGFAVGHGDRAVTALLVSLDVTEESIAEAEDNSCELIVSHHPVIFHPIRRITSDDPVGRRLLSLTEKHMAVISAHTNLDVAAGGVNDALASVLGLRDVRCLLPEGEDERGVWGLGRIGSLPEEFPTVSAFARSVRDRLDCHSLRFADAGRSVRVVAVGGGACGDSSEDARRAGADTFVTADVKYSTFLDAVSMGINLIDAGHFPTENVVCRPLASALREAFPQVRVLISSHHRELITTL